MRLDFVIELAPESAQARGRGPIVRMPGLETLIARGDAFDAPAGTCDLSLIAMFGLDPRTVVPNAALYALGEGIVADTGYWLRADPVCLQPTTSRLTLQQLAHDALTLAEAQALGTTLAEHFAANDYALFTPHPQRWYLRLKDAPDLQTLSPNACAGTLQESDLPSGRDGAHWKRMITEAQILLHSHPVNAARDAQGKLPANAIWPWGGGRLPPSPRQRRYGSVLSDDLLVRGLAAVSGVPVDTLPLGASVALTNASGIDSMLIVLRPPFALDSAALEEQWFVPLRAALESGRLTELSLTVWGTRGVFARRMTRAHLRRWWRRRQALPNDG